MAIQENITQNQPPIDDKAVALLYEDLKDSYDVGSLEDFKAYLSDKETRDLFFEQVIKPEYDVDTIDDFESAYGFAEKKKSSRYSFKWSRGSYGIHYRDSNRTWLFGFFAGKR